MTSPTRTYRGEIVDGQAVVTVDTGSRRRDLRHIVKHSPTGFGWGYGGSGPADLALSLLADALGERPSEQQLRWGTCRAWTLHQPFKWDVVSRWARDGVWQLTQAEILAWARGQTN